MRAVDGYRGGECHFVPARLEGLHGHFGNDFARQTAAHPCRQATHVSIDRTETDAERSEFGTGKLYQAVSGEAYGSRHGDADALAAGACFGKFAIAVAQIKRRVLGLDKSEAQNKK